MKAETRMTVTSGDVAATATGTAAMSMPWWLAQMPEFFAIVAAPVGFAIVIFTLAIKVNEWRLSRIRLREAEGGK